jgi:hypothetical protein
LGLVAIISQHFSSATISFESLLASPENVTVPLPVHVGLEWQRRRVACVAAGNHLQMV